MIPLRLVLVFLGIFIVILFLISNPQEVSFHFLFWKSVYRLYEVIIFSMILGVLLYILVIGHIKDVMDRKK
ncbi:MAG: LapA family protein [Leptospiraceae bacterium]|nr:LapA family protein [Leptospiraceae bacterium]